MTSIVQLVSYLHNLMNLTTKQCTTVESLRAELAEAKEEISKLSADMHGRKNIYRHNQLEELRNLQENISRERQEWERTKEKEQEWLRQEKEQLEAKRMHLEKHEAQGMITRNQNSRSTPSNLALVMKLAEPGSGGKSRGLGENIIMAGSNFDTDLGSNFDILAPPKPAPMAWVSKGE
nr:hypothetical protein BaRGS_029948 [Batillaria attramentaria]